MHKLILASSSPQRRELLRTLGRSFSVVPSQADETPPEDTEPERVVQILAERKAEAVARQLKKGLIIGADTIVAVAGRIIGKPRDEAHAREILAELSRTPHRVLTGVCIIDASTGRRRTACDETRVFMRPMSETDLQEYVSSGEPIGKAGAYAIQAEGDRFIERIEGSFSNVVGLPMELLERMLTEFEKKIP